jgi:hypothetical protein
MLWRAWLAPTPSPSLLRCTETGWGGGGELLMGRVLPGNSERGGVTLAGLFGWQKWRLNWADQSGDSFWWTKVVTLSGGPKWRAFWAVQFGDSGGRVNLASLFSGFC